MVRLEPLYVVASLATALLGYGYAQVSASTTSNDKVDARVKAAVDEIGWKYTINDSGTFLLTMKTEGTRTQLVRINSNTERYGEFEIREIWSTGFASDVPLARDTMRRLLEHSHDLKLGAWGISTNDAGRDFAIFCVRANADLKPDDYRTIVYLVSTASDEIEQEMVTGDDW